MWLTGYESVAAVGNVSYGEFLSNAPEWNSRSELITSSISGIKVESI